MKNHWKRFLSVVLTIALLSTLLVPMASAAGNRSSGSQLEKLKLTPIDMSASGLLLGNNVPEISGIPRWRQVTARTALLIMPLQRPIAAH